MFMLILPTDNWPITSLHSKTTNTLSRLPTAPETRPGSFSGTTLLQRYSTWPKKSIVVGIRQNPSLPGQNVPATRLTALSIPLEKPDQYRDLEPWTQCAMHQVRSEERRVGKECRSRWSQEQLKKKVET